MENKDIAVLIVEDKETLTKIIHDHFDEGKVMYTVLLPGVARPAVVTAIEALEHALYGTDR